MAIRVVLGEDNLIVREGVRQLLEIDPELEVVTAVGDMTSLRDACERERPDVVITDIRMPPTHTDEGIRIASWVHETYGGAMGVLVLSQHVDPEFALRLVTDARGGLGYLLKERVADIEDFVDAVRRVSRGGAIVDPSVVREVVRRQSASGLMDFTQRERDVLELMAEGRSNAAIGAQLSMSPKTVESHVGTIFSKLELEPTPDDNRRVLAVLAFLRRPE